MTQSFTFPSQSHIEAAVVTDPEDMILLDASQDSDVDFFQVTGTVAWEYRRMSNGSAITLAAGQPYNIARLRDVVSFTAKSATPGALSIQGLRAKGGYSVGIVSAPSGSGSGSGGGGDASAANQTSVQAVAGADAAKATAVQGITNGKAIPVSATALPLPAGAATNAAQTTGNNSLSSIDGKLPALASGKVPVTDPTALPLPAGAATAANQLAEIAALIFAGSTREYVIANKATLAYTGTSANIALPTLNANREVYVMANTRCYFKTTVGAGTVTATDGHPLAADERFHYRIPAGNTFINVIQDSAGGTFHIVPVA